MPVHAAQNAVAAWSTLVFDPLLHPVAYLATHHAHSQPPEQHAVAGVARPVAELGAGAAADPAGGRE